MSGRILVGEITAPFGVRGWVKVRSFTDPPQNLLDYRPWYLEGPAGLEGAEVSLLDGRLQGAGLVALIKGVEDRDQALTLRGHKISVPRDVFPEPLPGIFYWADLVGLRVANVQGQELGRVTGLLETGANDVLVVKAERERLIPFVVGEYVKTVDLEAGFLEVDWDPEF